MKAQLAKGTRDFGAEAVAKRKYVFDILRQIFELHGFTPLETPAFENRSTLTGKYGEEGDRLLFSILQSGDFLEAATQTELLEAKGDDKARLRLTNKIADKALRYDLTIPLARYVANNWNDLPHPYKRYQIQPVWRADRPQRGRFREFYQCDVDVVGSESLFFEAELLSIYVQAFSQFGIPGIIIKVNNRKILAGLAEHFGIELLVFSGALDKLDKIGWDGVSKEWESRGVNQEAQIGVKALIESATSLEDLSSLAKTNETIALGVAELQQTLQIFETLKRNNSSESSPEVVLDFTLARGLDYYTGFIVEVTTDAVSMGSLGGGGRYANLTELFGLKGVSGVGMSFGAERIIEVMDELDLFPKEILADGPSVVICAIDEASLVYSYPVLSAFHSAKISATLYPEANKLKKALQYANSSKAKFALIIGEEERESGALMLRNLETGDQQKLSTEEIIQQLTA